MFPNSYPSGAEIEIIIFRSGTNWDGFPYKSIGFRAASQSSDSTTCLGTPKLVVNTSSTLTLACYTNSGWVLATSLNTGISVHGYVEIRTLQLV